MSHGLFSFSGPLGLFAATAFIGIAAVQYLSEHGRTETPAPSAQVRQAEPRRHVPAPPLNSVVPQAGAQSSFAAVNQPSSGASRIVLAPTRNGMYKTDAAINGRFLPVMVDTGATYVALPYEEAERIGLRPRPEDFTWRSSTANGTAKVAPVMLENVRIGGIERRNVKAVIMERGAMRETLLGMSFLSQLAQVSLEEGRLVLKD